MSINYRKFINRNEEKGNELDKAVKLASIKKGLDTEYSIFMTSYQNKVVKKPEKIRSEYNKIFFKNICKEKTIADLEKQIMMQKRLRRNGSFGSLDQFNGLKNAEFMENEYTTTVFKLEEELVENEILKNMLLKEKHKLRNTLVKIEKVCKNKEEMEKYSEKVLRTASFAGNLYQTSLNFLKSAKRNISQEKTKQIRKIQKIKSNKLALSNKITNIESKVMLKTLNQAKAKEKINSFSNHLEILSNRNSINNAKNEINSDYTNEIKKISLKLNNVIKASKFIDTVENQNIALGEMGKYLNIMAFAEAQLEVRLLNLINMQKTYQDSVEVLQKEFRALQDNLKDSEFIEALKANRPDVRLFSFDAEAKNNWKTIEINEKIGMFMARGLLEMQSYFNTLVEEINANTVKLADQSPSDSSRKFLKKRTLSVQYSITTLPVIKENSTTTSFYQFDQMVKSLLLHKFNDFSSPTCQKFVKVLSHSEILKSFLTSSDISFFLGSIDESISMFRNFYLLYKPAHENLRRKIGISLRSVLSFISGIKVTSGQIMLSFDRNILSGRQTDKLMALDPKVKYVSRGLKEIIQERIEKNLAGVHTKGNSQGIIRKNPEIQVAGQDSDEEIFAKTAKTSRQTPHKGKWRTQKDFKAHLNSLSSMLLKSSKKKFK